MNKLVDWFGGQRFVMTMGCGFVTALLCATGKISGEVYADTTIWTVGVFIAGELAPTLPILRGSRGQNPPV